MRRRGSTGNAQVVEGSTVHGNLVQASMTVSGEAHIDQRTILAPTAMSGRDLYQYTSYFSGPVPSPPVVRRGLARDTADFLGRHGELKRLLHQARSRGGAPIICTIDGMPGVGKTALATRAAHLLAEDFPDGQFFVPLRANTGEGRPTEPAEALEDLLRETGILPIHIPASLEGRARLWRDHTASRRLLLVLDDPVGPSQIEPILPTGTGCMTLVTSRRRLEAVDGAVPLSLGELPAQEAADLFERVSRRQDLAPEALAEIIGLCGRLPLAIVLAAGRLAHRPSWTAREFAAALRDTDDRLGPPGSGPHTIRTAFDVSYRHLSSAQQLLFRRLCLHPGPEVDAQVAAAASGLPVADAIRALDNLFLDHLVEELRPGRYQLHDLLRLYANDTSAREDAEEDVAAAQERILSHFDDLVQTAGGPDPMPETLRTEAINVLALAEWAAAESRWSSVVRLAGGMAEYLRREGPWRQARRLHAQAAEAAGHLEDYRAKANALLDQGWVEQAMGEYQAATGSYEHASQLFLRLDDVPGRALALNALGWVRQLTGDLSGAAQVHQEALELSRAVGDGAGQAQALNQLGRLRQAAADYRGAIRLHSQALKLFRVSGDRAAEANAGYELAWALAKAAGWSPHSRPLYERSLALYKELGHRLGEANASYGLSRCLGGAEHASDGRDRDALQADALALYRALGNRLGEAIMLNDAGRSAWLPEEQTAAIGKFEQALKLFRELGSPVGEANALEGIGMAYHRKLDFVHAERFYEQAIERYRTLGDAEALSFVEHQRDEIRTTIDGYMTNRRLRDRVIESALRLSPSITNARLVVAQRRARELERRRLQEVQRQFRFHR